MHFEGVFSEQPFEPRRLPGPLNDLLDAHVLRRVDASHEFGTLDHGGHVPQVRGRPRQWMFPEFLEAKLHLVRQRPAEQKFQVNKIGSGVQIEIAIGHIAPPDQCMPAVDDQQLVVHAVVQRPKAAQHAQRHPGPADHRLLQDGVVQPEFQPLVGQRERREQRRVGRRKQAIEQHPDRHTAARRSDQLAHELPTRDIVVDDVALNDDALSRRTDQVGAHRQRVRSVVDDQQAVPGLATRAGR